MATDLYLVMGVDANAAPEQITAAYQHWTEASDPDRDAQATADLQELQEAYAILGHPERRRRYEQQVARQKLTAPTCLGQAHRAEASERAVERIGPRSLARQPIEVSLREPVGETHPSFQELFDRLWSNFSLLTRPKSEHLESLTVEIALSQQEARAGGRARIMIPARARCSACLGHGAIGLYQCWRCQGHGSITADYPVDVAYPAGLLNESVVRVPLSRFGIENFYLTVRFRVTAEAEWPEG